MLLTGMSDGGTFSYVSGLQSNSPFTHLAPCSASFHPMLLEVVADRPRLLALQRAMFAHAADVLYEAPASRVGDHLLRLVATAVTTLCVPSHRNDALMRKSHGVSYDDPPPRPAPKLPKKKKKKKRLAAAR